MVLKVFKKALLEKGLVMEHASKSRDIADFARLWQDATVGVDLIRIGSATDGGYLVPDDLNGVTDCFSPGVADRADFEMQLADDYGIRCFMADASVSSPPLTHPLFDFEQKFLGFGQDDRHISLQDWVDRKAPQERGDMILQMDIEGGEYDVLIETSRETLRSFRFLVIEFHQLDRLFRRSSLPYLRAIFKKIFADFALVHIHPNNTCGEVSCHGYRVPRVLEMTFLRRDRLEHVASRPIAALPHPLDAPNSDDFDDMALSKVWWSESAS